MKFLDNPILQWELHRIRQRPWRIGGWVMERLSTLSQVLILAVILGCGLICGMGLPSAYDYLGLILSFVGAIPAWIAPSLTAVTIAREREVGTLDMLRVTLLDERAIIYGKLAACLARLWPGFLVLLGLIPFHFLRGGLVGLFSGLSVRPEAAGQLWWWVISATLAVSHSLVDPLLYAAVGLSYSVQASSTGQAILLSYAVTFALSLIFSFSGILAAILLGALTALPSQAVHVLMASGLFPAALLLIKILSAVLMLRGAVRRLERL